MLKLIKKYPRAFTLAILLHIVLGVSMMFSLDWQLMPDIPEPEVTIVQATAVDESVVQQEIARLKKQEADRIRKENRRVEKLEQRADKAKRERQEEKKRIEQLAKERQEEAERKRLAQQERQQAEAEAKKAETERQAALEAEKRAREAADKAKAEADRELERQRRADDERMRQQMLEEEQKRMAAAKAKTDAKTVASYKGKIKQKTERYWREPVKFTPGARCDVMVRLLATGRVISARVQKCSGGADDLFKSSAERAVMQASPFEVPKEPALFNEFRQFVLDFNPSPKK